MVIKCRILNCQHNDYSKSENDTGICHCNEQIEIESNDCCGMCCSQYNPVEEKEKPIEVKEGSSVIDSNNKLLGFVTTVDSKNNLVVYKKLSGIMAQTTIDYVMKGLISF